MVQKASIIERNIRCLVQQVRLPARDDSVECREAGEDGGPLAGRERVRRCRVEQEPRKSQLSCSFVVFVERYT